MGSKTPKIRCNCFHYHHHPKPNSLGHVGDNDGNHNGDGEDNGGDSDGDDNVNGEDNGGDDEDNDGGDNDNVQNECNQCVGTTTLLCRLALMQMSF